MDFNEFDEIEETQDTEKSLSSYSDLFAAISFIFLFIYVIASMQAGVREISHNMNVEKVKKENEKQKAEIINRYEKRIAIYQKDKEIYLQEMGTPQEEQAYHEAITKLGMLQELKREEKEKLFYEYEREKEQEAAAKEYKTMLKDIVDANLVLKKNYKISENQKNLMRKTMKDHKNTLTKNLKTEFNNKEKVLAVGYKKKEKVLVVDYEKKEGILVKEYSKKKKQLDLEFEKKFNSKRKELDKEKQQFIATIKHEKSEEVKKARKEYEVKKLSEIKSVKEKYKNNKNKYMEKKQAELSSKIDKINTAKDKKIAQIEGKFNSELKATQNKYAKKEDSLEKRYNKKQAQLEQSLNGKIANVSSEQEKLKELQDVYSQKAKLAEQNAAQRKSEIAGKIMKEFEGKNMPVKINPTTGELTLTFNKGYFEFAKHDINNEMKEVLKKVIPLYAKSIGENKAQADFIEAIEIVGYSSPVFQGKYVNPGELKPKNFWGLNYNMDLSYRRARSIYKYMFDSLRFKYDYQQDLFLKTKVSGRSYIEGRKPANAKDKELSGKEYCEKYKCDEQHKVVMKLILKD